VLSFLSSHMLVVVLLAVVLALLVAGYIGLVLWRARRQESGEEASAEAEPSAAVTMVTQAADLEMSFRRALKTLRSVTTGSEYRYRIPWYLMLGPVGTGKTTLVESLPLPRRVQADSALPSSERACRWHFFDDGVVLDVAGTLTLKANLTSDEVGWRRLLSLLKRYRSERPVDGVILTLSAADLLSWESRPADEVRAIGTGLFQCLRRAQAELGVRFPVYVILTGADRLPGFSSFAAAVPRRFHQDIFGWSNPYALDAAFRGEWVDEAMSEVGDWLRDRATEVLASRSLLPGADAVFRFADVALRLVPATKTLLSEIFEQSAYHESFFLRGIYFTGRVEESRAAHFQPEETTVDSDAGSGGGDGRDDLVFAGRLFQKKIFPERGLARAFARGLLDRNRLIRWIQIAAAALVIFGIPGMWLGHASLERKARPLGELLDSVGNNFSLMSADMSAQSGGQQLTQMGRENVVFELLQQMARLNAGPFWSLALPSSWFSSLDGEITQNLTGGFQDVILPTMRMGIIQWADTLSDEHWATTIGQRIPPPDSVESVHSIQELQEYRVLIRYMSEVRQFITNAGRFNQIAQRGSDEMQLFSKLFVWYYEQELPPEFFKNDEFYRRALAGASESPVAASDWPGFEPASARVATFLTDRFYGRLDHAVGELDQDFNGTVDPSSFTTSDLRRLWEDVGQVEDLLTSSDTAWLRSDAPLAPALQLMLDSLPDSSPLFAKKKFVMPFINGFDQVRSRRLATLSGELAALSQAFVSGTSSAVDSASGGRANVTRIALGSRLTKLRTALGDLLNQSFMTPVAAPPGQAPPTFAGRPTWTVGPLDDALGYFREYQTFRDSALDNVPSSLQGLVLGVANRSLKAHVSASLTRAMTYTSGVEPEGRAGMEQDLQARLKSFDQAARRLVGMLDVDAKFGGTPAGASVAETIILESSDLLDQVDDLLGQDGLYAPVDGSLAIWHGKRPASWAGFGVSSADGLEQYLAEQRQSLRDLSQYASQILGYLTLPPVADLLRSQGRELVPDTEALMRKWRGIVQTLDDYDKKTPGNSLGALDQFIRQDMAIESLSKCPAATQQAEGPARDYFDSVRTHLAGMLRDRCGQLARLTLRQGYEDMRRLFSTRLAGRFPFVDLTTTPDAPDADVADVRRLLEMYDDVQTSVNGDVASVAEFLGGSAPADFLRRVGEMRRFLGPLVLPDSEGVARAVAFRVELRTDRGAERGADQIVDWRLRVGSDSVTYLNPAGGTGGQWHLGDPVSMSLVWASGSKWRPVSDQADAAMTVDSTTATWQYGGPWSLLRLIAAHRPRAADLSGGPAEDRSTVNLRVLTRSRNASDVKDSRGEMTSVFLHLRFTTSAQGGTLAYPRFPVRTPTSPTR
jgi:type VI secretion system protein ImpL